MAPFLLFRQRYSSKSHIYIVKYAPIFLLLISLLGCATHPKQADQISSTDEAIKALSAQPCCAELKDLRALPLSKVGEDFDFQIAPPDRPLMSARGRAYARMLTLPDDHKAYHFMISSYSSKVRNFRQIYAPVVLVLNEDYSLSRKSDLQTLRVDVENPMWQERERITLFVKVDRSTRPKEKYLVVTTDPAVYGKFLDLRSTPGPQGTPLYYVTRVTPEPSSKFLPDPIQVGPEGVLRITNLSSAMRKPFDYWIMF